MATVFIAFGACTGLFAAVAIARLWLELRKLRQTIDIRTAAARIELFCPMTGLANRLRALDWLAAAMADEGRPAAVVISLDTTWIDEGGQKALAGPIAQRLLRLVRQHELVARLGLGKYLLAIAGECEASELLVRAQSVRDAVAALVGEEPCLGVGVAFAKAGDSAEALLSKAEGAIARQSEGPISAHGEELERALRNRAIDARALAQAIADGRIEPFFQPLVQLGSGKVLGFEVLARWRDEDGRVRLPGEFVPLAEETGLVGEMFFALLRRAAVEVRRWPAEWSFTLNLSPQQFADERLVDRTVQILLRAGLAPGRLELEITERALEANPDAAKRVIATLRRHGIQVALDNFGRGRISPRELAQLEFDRLKVDGSLLEDERDGGAMLGAIVAAARHLGVPVVVQGIETRDRASQVHLQGAAIGQGFLFGRPDPQTEYFRLEGSLVRHG